MSMWCYVPGKTFTIRPCSTTRTCMFFLAPRTKSVRNHERVPASCNRRATEQGSERTERGSESQLIDDRAWRSVDIELRGVKAERRGVKSETPASGHGPVDVSRREADEEQDCELVGLRV